MARHYDVAVIGGGPAGLQAARRLAERGADTVLFEVHARIGVPQHCTGLVSVKGFERWIRAPRSAVLWSVRGGVLHSPGGLTLTIDTGGPVAYVLDRVRLEEELFSDALSRGVEARLGVRAAYRPGRVVAGGVEAEAGLIVYAGGLPRGLGWTLPSLQYDYEAEPLGDTGLVHVFLGERYSRGLFAWAVPLGEERVRVGVASLGDVRRRLEGLVEQLGGLYRLRRRVRVMGGAVYVGGPLYPFYREGVARIGDAAGQTKPTTGGGLVYHAAAADMLALAYGAGDISYYEGLWKRVFGREVAVQKAVRRMLWNLPDKGYEKLFEAAREAGAEPLLRGGDMDMQSKALIKAGIKTLVRAPSLALTLLYELLHGLIAHPQSP